MLQILVNYSLSSAYTQPVADLHSKILDAPPPPGGPNSFNFMQFLGKYGKIVCWRPPWGVGAPSSGKSWIRHCQRKHYGRARTPPPPQHTHPGLTSIIFMQFLAKILSKIIGFWSKLRGWHPRLDPGSATAYFRPTPEFAQICDGVTK